MDRGITNPPVLIGRTFFDAGLQIRRDAIWRDYVWNFDGINNKNTSRRSIYCIGTYFFVCRDVVVATSGCNFSRVVGCLESPLRAYSYISKNLILGYSYISKIPLSAPLAIFSKSSPKSQNRMTALAAACLMPILSPCKATAA